MRRSIYIVTAIALLSGGSLGAQTQQDRTVYEPQYRIALTDFQREEAETKDVEQQMAKETDLAKGCALLRSDVEHLQKQDTILTQLEDFSRRLHWDKQHSSAVDQHTAVAANIQMRQADIDRLCKNV